MRDQACPQTDREITFERWWNVRDLGGLPTHNGGTTQPGRVYRSATPQHATPGDIKRAIDLGLTSFVDLRRSIEDWRDAMPGFTTMRVDVLADVRESPSDTRSTLVRDLLDRAKHQIAAAVGTITDLATKGPVVFHCYAGKDRTGVIAIVLLKLADVTDDAVIEDFLATNPHFEAMRTTMTAELGGTFMASAPIAVQRPVDRDGAVSAFKYLDECGGAADYLQSGGMTPTDVARAVALLR